MPDVLSLIYEVVTIKDSGQETNILFRNSVQIGANT